MVHHLHKMANMEVWEVVTQVKGDAFCTGGKDKKNGEAFVY